MGLDNFIDRIIEKTCPTPISDISETALRQLRPVFQELLKTRVALEDIIMIHEKLSQTPVTHYCSYRIELAEKIEKAKEVL